jgi:hypothetical protein
MTRESRTVSDADKVTIYIWKMNYARDRLGHASMRTYKGAVRGNGHYMSFWPAEKSLRQKSLAGVPSHSVRSLEDDVLEEDGSQSDHVIDLYSLNVDKINQAYAQFIASNCNWSLWGSSFFRDENTRNCSGLCLHLLKEGGIDALLTEPVSVEMVMGTGAGSATAFFGLGGGAWVGFAGGSSNVFLGSSVAKLVMLVGLPATPGVVFAGGVLMLATAGATTGLALTQGKYLLQGKKAIITPDGVARIIQAALASERERYDFKKTVPRSVIRPTVPAARVETVSPDEEREAAGASASAEVLSAPQPEEPPAQQGVELQKRSHFVCNFFSRPISDPQKFFASAFLGYLLSSIQVESASLFILSMTMMYVGLNALDKQVTFQNSCTI